MTDERQRQGAETTKSFGSNAAVESCHAESRPLVTWNGKDVPPELRELPAGRSVVEPFEDEAPTRPLRPESVVSFPSMVVDKSPLFHV